MTQSKVFSIAFSPAELKEITKRATQVGLPAGVYAKQMIRLGMQTEDENKKVIEAAKKAKRGQLDNLI